VEADDEEGGRRLVGVETKVRIRADLARFTTIREFFDVPPTPEEFDRTPAEQQVAMKIALRTH